MKIRNLDLNSGKPAVCVPVTEKDQEGIIEHIQELAGSADMIEWRIDYFEDIYSLEKITAVLKKARAIAKNTPLLGTIRTDLEGGNFPVKSGDYKETIKGIAESGCADLIDIEYDTLGDDRGIIGEVENCGVKTVLSHHDFNCTPDTKTMYDYLISMKDAGADIVKLAVMPKDSSDVLRLLQVTNDFHKDLPETPLITMSMGSIGTISRLCGQTFGSCITFGADREASAPGQIDFEELKEIVRILDEAE